MKKKADISVNVVIIAVLALLVLIILAFIFSGKLKVFNTGAGSCKGECIIDSELDTSDRDNPSYYYVTSNGKCNGPVTSTSDTNCKEVTVLVNGKLSGGTDNKDKLCCVQLI